ncbi:hypothetical protein BJY52DRAFT_1228883 [Lactarius psammicola]|nr:hypothetical protein BJY52DRAFT_1228883 [Lactarius psammicola]
MDQHDSIVTLLMRLMSNVRSPGGTQWDIFLPEDTMQLRKILSMHPKPKDPVLTQNTYLNPARLHELELKHNIKAYTFFLHEGEAVFIPVGVVTYYPTTDMRDKEDDNEEGREDSFKHEQGGKKAEQSGEREQCNRL